MLTANIASLIGLSLIAAALIAVFFSPYRRLFTFMGAGMLFWGLVEVLRLSMQALFELPLIYSYLTASMLSMALIAMLLLREEQQRPKLVLNLLSTLLGLLIAGALLAWAAGSLSLSGVLRQPVMQTLRAS